MTGLQPGSNYLGEVVGFNVKGVGVPTIVRVYTLKLPEKLIPPILAEPAPSEYSRIPRVQRTYMHNCMSFLKSGI